MHSPIAGAIHFHSDFSHDGRSSLEEIRSRLVSQGLSFCIMTDHFEDFTEQSFDCYLERITVLNRTPGFVFVPGVEVSIGGIDTLLYPVYHYSQCRAFPAEETGGASRMRSVLAHPSKYAAPALERHMQRVPLTGIELWNQLADGLLPSSTVVRFLQSVRSRHSYRYFFGCDIHNARHGVRNIVTLPARTALEIETIVGALDHGSFSTANRTTGRTYESTSTNVNLDQWLATASQRRPARLAIRCGVRRSLRSAYRLLPRRLQRSLNTLKNYVRNEV